MNSLTTTQEAATVGAVAGAMGAIMAICIVATYILFIIAWWKIFTKAGIAGWKSLIPFYNQYLLFRISGMSGWWVILPVVVALLGAFGSSTTQTNGATTANTGTSVIAIIVLIGVIACVVVEIVQIVKLAGAFGKGTLFKVMSVFFPNITSLILAFGAAKYNKKAMHD